MKKSILVGLGICCMSGSEVCAQNRVEAEAEVAMVSSYLWRGYKNAGASVQPGMTVGYKGLSAGIWGSQSLTCGGLKEVDLYLSYEIKGLTVGVSDYWWDEGDAYGYFQYRNGNTSHSWEANIAYELPFEKFPFVLSWNTVFAGEDYNEAGERCYSSYMEVMYPFSIGAFDFEAAVGATPWHSPVVMEERSGFSVCNISLGAAYVFEFGRHFQLPLTAQLVYNPALNQFHAMAGITFLLKNK
ncbi:MAG: hypothetical protein ACRCX1_05940 [Bacteroidales bacterium]